MATALKQTAFAFLLLSLTCAFSTLGIWQVQRLIWKKDLIEQTERKLAQSPAFAPGPSDWTAIGSDDAYTRIHAKGHFIAGHDVFIVASTIYGRGYWVVTPLQTDDFVLLINRGFVTSNKKKGLKPPEGIITLKGLLRLTEPNGSLLQRNVPSQNRWFSRDTAAISEHLGLKKVAPYFMDEEASEKDDRSVPIKGLTVVSFPNNHLQYAITWFALAVLSFWALCRFSSFKGRE